MKKYSNQTDLFIALKAGDEDAYRILVENVYETLNHYAYRIVEDKIGAEDVAIMAIRNCWQSMNKMKTYGQLHRTLYTAALNLSLNYLRAKQRQDTHQAALRQITSVSDNSILNAIYYKELVDLLKDEIRKMPDLLQLVITYTLFEDKTPKVIAQQLGMKYQTVISQKNKALTWLQKWLRKQGYCIIIYLTILNFYSVSQKNLKMSVFGVLHSTSAVSSIYKPYSAKYH